MGQSFTNRGIPAAVLAVTGGVVLLSSAARAADAVSIVPGTFAQGTVLASLNGGSYGNASNNLGDWPLNTGAYGGGLAAISFENPDYNNSANPNSLIAFGNGGGVTLQFATPIMPVAGEKDLGIFTAQAITTGSGALFNSNMAAAILVSADGHTWYTLTGMLVGAPTTYTANASLLNAPTMAYSYGNCATAWNYGKGTPAANLNALTIASYTTPMPNDNLFNGNGSNAQRLALSTDTSAADYAAIFGNSGGGNWFDISGSGLSQVNFVRLNGDANDPSYGGVRLDAVFASANGSLVFDGSGNYTDGNALSGSSPMTVSCPGTVTLCGNNAAYTGTANISSGTFNLANMSALVNGSLNLTGGNVTFDQNAGGTSFAIASTSGSGGNVVLQTNAATPVAVTLTVGTGNSSTSYGGLICGAGTLIKVGNGTLTLTNTNTYVGGTTINAGTLEVATATNGLLSGSNVANYAALQFDGAQTIGSISGNGTTIISGTGNLTVANFVQTGLTNNGIVCITGNATIGQLTGSGNLTIGNGASNNTVQLTPNAIPDSFTHTQQLLTIASGAKLDITNNLLLLNYGSGSSPLAAVQAAVANGMLMSSTANAGNPGQYAVGYADSTELGSLPSGSVEVMCTLAGDALLTGTVNFNDFSVLQNNYNQSGRDWSQGDFNHDGTVNFNDYSLLQNNYNQNLFGATSDAINAVEMNETTSLPEPANISALVLCSLPLSWRRRKPRK